MALFKLATHSNVTAFNCITPNWVRTLRIVEPPAGAAVRRLRVRQSLCDWLTSVTTAKYNFHHVLSAEYNFYHVLSAKYD